MKVKPSTTQEILDALPSFVQQVEGMREILLSDVVMAGEIPATTGQETRRIQWLIDRFTESGLNNISRDEMGNGAGLLPGQLGERTILVTANADSEINDSIDHSVSVGVESLVGVGLGNNSISVAVLAFLPVLMERLGIQLQSNLLLVGSAQNLDHADLQGFRFFLDNVTMPIDHGICLRGSELGRVSFASLGMLGGEITCEFSESERWRRSNFPGAIVELHQVLDRILRIPVPQVPRTSIILGSIIAGTSFSEAPARATLRFEVRSEDEEMVRSIGEQIQWITDEVAANTNAKVEFHRISSRQPGCIPFSHPMVRQTHGILETLDIVPKVRPSAGLLSGLIAKGIPAMTLGLTHRTTVDGLLETMKITPLYQGVAQLLALLLAVDGGLCDEQN